MNIPEQWDRQAHQLWLGGKKVSAIQAVIQQINQHGAKKPFHYVQQVGFYLFLFGDYQGAANIYLSQLAHYPDNPELLLNLAVSYGRGSRPKEAITYAERVLDLDKDNFVAADTLSASYHKVGNPVKAAYFGNLSLTIKDAQTQGQSKLDFPEHGRTEFISGKRNIITFSLWGQDPRYLAGAIKNVIILRELMPAWQVRIYLDTSVPEDIIDVLKDFKAELIFMPDGQTTKEKLTWRFLVSDDTSVGLFLVRDIDSLFSVREVIAIQEWVESDCWFHVIRDWWTHTDLILAGMWGGVAGVLPNMANSISSYIPKHVDTPNVDQWFLRDLIWQQIKPSCLIHDRFFGTENGRSLPNIFNSDNHHIGQNAFYLGIDDPLLACLASKCPSLKLQ